jgi:hypothetical protein
VRVLDGKKGNRIFIALGDGGNLGGRRRATALTKADCRTQVRGTHRFRVFINQAECGVSRTQRS